MSVGSIPIAIHLHLPTCAHTSRSNRKKKVTKLSSCEPYKMSHNFIILLVWIQMVRFTLHLLCLSNLHSHPTLHTIPLQFATASHFPDKSDHIGWTSSGIMICCCRKYNIPVTIDDICQFQQRISVTIDDICQFQQRMHINYNVVSYCVGNRHGVTLLRNSTS
jgi:hypothetical protein